MHVADDFIIADKPSGLLSVPGIGPEKAVCANSILSERHGPVLTVHRLDMDTSGLMVFARTKHAQRALYGINHFTRGSLLELVISSRP